MALSDSVLGPKPPLLSLLRNLTASYATLLLFCFSIMWWFSAGTWTREGIRGENWAENRERSLNSVQEGKTQGRCHRFLKWYKDTNIYSCIGEIVVELLLSYLTVIEKGVTRTIRIDRGLQIKGNKFKTYFLIINVILWQFYGRTMKFHCSCSWWRISGSFTLHGTGTGNGTRTIGNNGSGSGPCLRPVRTLLYNILEPIDSWPILCTCPGPMQCE